MNSPNSEHKIPQTQNIKPEFMWEAAYGMCWNWKRSPLQSSNNWCGCWWTCRPNQYLGELLQSSQWNPASTPSFPGAWAREKKQFGGEWMRAGSSQGGWMVYGRGRLAMCGCCNAVLQQTCLEQQWASWLACLFQKNMCTGRLSPRCDSLQSMW